MTTAKILVGNVKESLLTLPKQSVQTIITSPPYWGLRDYGMHEQIGLEETPKQFVDSLVDVFRLAWDVLKDDGTLWLNLGDSYCGTGNKGEHKDPKYVDGRTAQAVALNNKVAGLKSKDLIGIPWRVAFALQDDGWYLRQDIIWHKPNPMPESVTDRCTKSHEYLFLLSKRPQYFFDHDAISELSKYAGDDRGSRTDSRRGTSMNSMSGATKETRNKRNVWDIQPNIVDLSQEIVDYALENHGIIDLKIVQQCIENEIMFSHDPKSIWVIPTQPFKGAHFAVMPEALVEPCVLAGSKAGDVVLDPFAGSGTVGLVALRNDRTFVGCELNPEYAAIAKERIGPLFTDVQPILPA